MTATQSLQGFNPPLSQKVRKQYQKTIRERQVERAEKIVNIPSSLKAKRATDPKRFVASYPCTKEGELAEKDVVVLDTEAIDREACYDGFYAVCTNLEGDPLEVIQVNKGRWAILTF